MGDGVEFSVETGVDLAVMVGSGIKVGCGTGVEDVGVAPEAGPVQAIIASNTMVMNVAPTSFTRTL